MSPKVVILGGGVAALSAAHELAERGFEVEVFERRDVPGGKARSISVGEPPVPGAPEGSGGKPWLPGEHGFRFFPGFYKHVVDTMRRIPCGGGSVADNLVDTTEIQIARFGRPSVVVPARFPVRPTELRAALQFVLALLGGELDLPREETAFLAGKVWQVFTSCEERRMTEYERLSWWDFIEAEARSEAYQLIFGHGITRSLVAAKARRASTKTIGDVFAQMLLYILQPGVTSDRVLNGPTSHVWITPWLAYLRSIGVRYEMGAEVASINVRDRRITSATIVQGGRTFEARGDYFVAALPVERMAELVTPALVAADPALQKLTELSEQVEWMNGIQFYLTEDVPLVHGHTIFLESPWALTSISQAQFWPDYDLSAHGDGRVRGILSVDISNWTTQGSNGKTAQQCTREEIRREVWDQIKRSINVGGVEILSDEHVHFWFLDPDIQESDPVNPGHETNLEPLLVNYAGTWSLRPEASTGIPNLFLASDYVRTYTDLATMEGANEAARRATNGILAASGSKAAPCTLWNLHEPELLAPLREYDRQRFARNLPWDGLVTDVAESLLKLSRSIPPASTAMERSDPEAAGRLANLVDRLQRDAEQLAGLGSLPASAESAHPVRPPLSRAKVRILPE